MALPGLVLFVLSLLSLLVWVIGRCCFNVFGGKHRSPGWFFPGDPDEFYEYSWKNKTTLKLIIFAAQAGVILCLILGLYGNSQLNNGLSKVENTLIKTGNDLLNKTQIVGQDLLALNYTHDAGQKVLQIEEQANEVLDQAKHYSVQVNKYNKDRSAGLIVLLVIPVVIMGVGSFGAVMDWKKYAYSAGIACFIGSALVWICFGIHYPTSMAVSDVCVEADAYLSGNTSKNGFIEQLTKCSNGGSGFQNITDTAEAALNKAYSKACEAATTICSSSPKIKCPSSCTRTSLPEYKDVVVEDYVEGCTDSGTLVCGGNTASCNNPAPCPLKNVTLEECATQCNNTQLRSLSQQTVQNIDLLDQYDFLITNYILPLLNCSFIQETMTDIHTGVCQDFKNGITYIAWAVAVMGILFVPATIALIMGWKRFRSQHSDSDEEVDLDDLEDGDNSKEKVDQWDIKDEKILSPKRESEITDAGGVHK